MAPSRGYLRSAPRRDSGAVLLWRWAQSQRRTWDIDAASSAARISARRAREIVAALHDCRYLVRAEPSSMTPAGQQPAKWRLSARGRTRAGAPILQVDGERGRVISVRFTA